MRLLKAVLLGLLIGMFSFPCISQAASLLHDEPPGTIITFSDRQWMILDQMPDGTTYVILNSNDGNRVFDTDNTQFFNPSDSNNIGYYLNNTFYNSLSQKELIVDHSWDIKYQDGSGSQSNVTAKVGLISYDEYLNKYRYLFPDNGTRYAWWTRTPSSGYSAYVWSVNSDGSLSYCYAHNSLGVRPALYLQSGIMISDTKEVIGTSGDITPPSVPTGLSATVSGPNEVQLTWDANSESDLAGYKIYRNGTLIDQTSTTSYTDTGLAPETEYTYTISAYDTSGNESAQCDPVTVTTPSAAPDAPLPPENVSVSNITDASATVQWDSVSGAEGYKVYLNGVEAGTTAETFYDLTLEPETEYTVTVSALAGGQESEQSEPVTFTILPAPVTPPGVPEFSAKALLGGGAVRLSWFLDDPTISKWEVYMDGTLIEELPGESTGTIIRDLDDGTYSFKVRAVNSAGAGEFSEEISVKVANIFGFATNILDVFTMVGLLLKSIWPLLAFVIALIAVPRVVGLIRQAIATRR